MPDLRDCTIVVTRPARQADQLIRRLGAAGARVIHYPVIAIEPLPSAGENTSGGLTGFDIVIFISRNAVLHGLPQLTRNGILLSGLRVAAVGRGTAEQLQQQGVTVDICPASGNSSEHLLAEPALRDVQDSRILIVRGVGGRELLATELRRRGAHIHYLECYRRELPAHDSTVLSKAWRAGGIDAVIVTSAESLQNLYRMVASDDLPRLNRTPLFVVSLTMAELSAKLGYQQQPVVMTSARDDDVLQALEQYCRAG